MSSQLWLHMAGYLNYISSRYVSISYFVSLKNYAGQKLNNLMWLSMAGEFMSIYFLGYIYLANVSSIDCGYQARVSVKLEYLSLHMYPRFTETLACSMQSRNESLAK